MNNKLERFKAFLDAKGIAYNATPDETLDLEEAVCGPMSRFSTS